MGYIRAAVDARSDSSLVIIARTDSRANLGLEEAIRRGRAYVEAGADVLFVEAPQSVDELKAIAKAFPNVPLVANVIEGGKTPQLSVSELQDMGYKIVFFAVSALLAATLAMTACLHSLQELGTTTNFNNMINFREFKEFIGIPQYQQMEEEYRGK